MTRTRADVEAWARTANQPAKHAARLGLTIKDGTVLVGSDAHYWPDIVTTAHRAFVHFARTLKPAAVVMNGDVIDGAGISRHAPIAWEDRPELVEEIDAAKERLAEIVKAAPKAAHIWPLGNHDARFESRLAQIAPEYARVHGVHLRDHFPAWSGCWALWINGSVVVKHRIKSGIHAAHLNTVNAGLSTVTGHLHSLKVTPFTDYNGTRYGVDTGTLAEPKGPQFVDYMETSPANWRSGFVVLTFSDGELLWPEVVAVRSETTVEFRGKVVRV